MCVRERGLNGVPHPLRPLHDSRSETRVDELGGSIEDANPTIPVSSVPTLHVVGPRHDEGELIAQFAFNVAGRPHEDVRV